MGLCLRQHIAIASAGIIAGVSGSAILTNPLWAQQWRVTPSLGVNSTFSDNINGATDGNEESDLVLTVTPGISVNGAGGRISLDFSYNPSYLYYTQGNGEDEFRHRLLGRSKVELIEQSVFVETQASISQQFVDSAAGVTDSADVLDSNNQTQVITFNINPEFRHHFGTWAESVTNYNFSFTHTDSDAVTSTDSQSASFVLSSGERFTSFKWDVSTSRSKSGENNERSNYRANVEYPFNRHISALAGAGYEVFDDDSLNSEPDGIIWNVGVRLNPGPRTQFTANYNDRFDDQFFSFEGSHKFGGNTNVNVSYTTNLTTSQGQLGEELANTSTNTSGQIIDPSTGLPFEAGDSSFGLTDNTFKQQRFQASVSGGRKRNSYSLQAFLETRETDATGADETVFGTSLRFSRKHTRKANSSVSFSYRNTDFGTVDGREDDFFTASASLSYRIFTDFNGSVAYNFSKRSSSVDSNDLTSNSLTVSLQKTF